jgi:hypothetical protein
MSMGANRVLLSLGLVGLLGLAGCSPKDIGALEGRVFFSVKESYRGAEEGVEPSLYLDMETEKIYGCLNYRILFDLVRDIAGLRVNIEGIEVPDVCLTALGPAWGAAFLELQEGVHSLEFRYGAGQRCVFEVTVENESISIHETSGSGGIFTVPRFTLWWRYPVNSFAVICGTTLEASWVFDDFLGRLQAGVDLVAHEFPPEGEIGYPRAFEGAQVDHPAKYFLFEGEADFSVAGEILREYVRDVIGGMTGVHIWLLNWKNESFRSWMMGSGP